MAIVFNKKGTVVFKQNTPTQSSSLGGVDSYSTLVTTDGRLRKRGSNRNLSAGEFAIDSQWELIVRYQDTIFNNIKPDTKVEIDSETYTIQSFEKKDEKRFYLIFTLNK